MSRRPRLGPVAPALVAVAAVAAVAAAAVWRGRPPDLSSWDEPRLARELEALGYRVHAEPADREGPPLPSGVPLPVLAGLYVSRDEPADWDDVARQRWTVRWRGAAVVLPRGGPAPEGDRRYLAAGRFLLFGDPELLDDIARALGLPR